MGKSVEEQIDELIGKISELDRKIENTQEQLNPALEISPLKIEERLSKLEGKVNVMLATTFPALLAFLILILEITLG